MVGGNSKYEVPMQLHSIAMNQQSVLGVHRGTRGQLSELVQLVAAKQVCSRTLFTDVIKTGSGKTKTKTHNLNTKTKITACKTKTPKRHCLKT